MINIGNFYKHRWYSIPLMLSMPLVPGMNTFIRNLKEEEPFVILEVKKYKESLSRRIAYKVLTTGGEVGWILSYSQNICEVQL